MDDGRLLPRSPAVVVTRVASCLAALVLMLSACVVDGEYVVRGAVAHLRTEGLVPVSQAEVRVWGHGASAGPAQYIRANADGQFQVQYRFGGVGFLVCRPGDGKPMMEVSAPGYASVQLTIRARELPQGVTRRPCPNQTEGCFEFEVRLTPQ
jgi:hypothetical protein